MNQALRRSRLFAVLVVPLCALVVFSVQGFAASSADKPPKPVKPATNHPHKKVCADKPGKSVHCDAEIVTADDGVTPLGSAAPAASSYEPADLQAAYALPSASAGTGHTVAVVDALDDPKAEADLATYRAHYGFSPCTTANGCFRKVNQNGAASPLPSPDSGWAQEISLDLDAVSAACPNCNILLVEASSTNFDDIVIAEDTAAAMGANAISNSYGGGEFSTEAAYESHYTHPGIAITASTGDSGYEVEYPAAGANVTAVGGTTLAIDSSARGYSETAWSGGGSGCSKYISKPPWQSDACANKTVADVSADANPNSGLAVYDSYGSSGTSNWFQIGGTSLASPLVAAVYALGNPGVGPAYPYHHSDSLYDIVSGKNGSCTPTYLCNAGPGYDGPTGLGTPNGTGAFGGAASSTASTSSTSSTSSSSTSTSSTSTSSTSTSTTSTTVPSGTQVVGNPGFETGSFGPWTPGGGAPTPMVTNTNPHSGAYSALLGTPASPSTQAGDSWVSQTITVPSTTRNVNLKFWYWAASMESSSADWQQAQIRATDGTVLSSVFKTKSNAKSWKSISKSLNNWRGKTIVIWFNVHQDANAKVTWMYLDDVTATVA